MEIYTEDESIDQFKAESCLLFYNIGDTGAKFVTANPIVDGRIFPGNLVTAKDFTDLLRQNLNSMQNEAEMEELDNSWGLLFNCKGVKAWLSPAHRRNVMVQGWAKDEKGKDLNVPEVKHKAIEVPDYIWVHHKDAKFNTHAYVFRIHGKFRGKDTQIAAPHLYNVYDTGKICWGTTNQPDYAHDICERFWGSMFSHTLQSKPFSAKRSTPLSKTIGDFVYDILGAV